MPVKLSNLWHMAVGPLRERGFVETIRSVRGCMRAARIDREEGFDDRFGTDTGKTMSSAELGSTGDDVPALWRYWPTLRESFERILEAVDVRFEDYVFVDLGSGKGRVLLLASECPFKRIVGVELSPRLHDVAQQNIRRFRSPHQRCRAFDLRCLDAGAWDPPPDPLLIYLFQPFPRETLAAVLDNLGRSLRARPRPAVIAYLNPLFDDQLMASGLFERSVQGVAQAPGEFDWNVYRHVAAQE